MTYKAVIDYKRFFSLNKLLRTTVYVLRFVHNIRCKKESRKIREITVNEISNAKAVIVKLVQRQEFKQEVKILKSDIKIPRSCRLVTLNPYLDDEGILRVGGRLKLCAVLYYFQYRTILPC